MISYFLTMPANVKLSVHDMEGKLIRTVAHEKQTVGKHVYKFAKGLAKGTYMYRLDVDGHITIDTFSIK